MLRGCMQDLVTRSHSACSPGIEWKPCEKCAASGMQRMTTVRPGEVKNVRKYGTISQESRLSAANLLRQHGMEQHRMKEREAAEQRSVA